MYLVRELYMYMRDYVGCSHYWRSHHTIHWTTFSGVLWPLVRDVRRITTFLFIAVTRHQLYARHGWGCMNLVTLITTYAGTYNLNTPMINLLQ